MVGFSTAKVLQMENILNMDMNYLQEHVKLYGSKYVYTELNKNKHINKLLY